MEVSINSMSMQSSMMTRAAKSKEYREKYGKNTIVLFDRGDRLVAYNESAEALANATGLTAKSIAGITTAAFPKEKDYVFFPRCVREGYRLVITEY